jgi:UDP-N-acetyl-D-glucosamine dehydrogenase
VGLPLAISFAQADFEVYGLDTNSDKINKIKLGESPVEDISSDVLVKLIKSAKFIPTDDASVISVSNIIIVCVPTPLNSVHEPDLTFLQSAIQTLSKHISKGA